MNSSIGKENRDTSKIMRHAQKYHGLDGHEKAGALAWDVAYKTEGIAFLLSWMNQEGSGDRDQEAMFGVSLIMEEIAEQGRLVAMLLEGNDIEINKNNNQEYSGAPSKRA